MSGQNNNTGEVLRRLERLEEADDRMKDSLNQLVLTTTTMAQTLDRLAQLDPIVTQLRLDNENQKLITSGVKWGAVTVAGAAIIMFLTYLVKLGG